MLGVHISIAGGIYLAPARGRAIGCDAIQIFSKSNRGWAAKPLTDEDRERLDLARRETGIDQIVVHACYLINLAADTDALWNRSFDAWKIELERCAFLGLDQIVLHPGIHGQASETAGIDKIARGLDRAFEQTEGQVRVLLEITAGQGTTSVGWRMEQLRDLIGRSRYPQRLGTCFDTCHAFAAGYDLRSAESYALTFDRFEDLLGLESIGCFHLNDSKKPLGSRVDRHANIGEGELGIEPFRLLLNDLRFKGRPMLLETPGDPEVWQAELCRLRALRTI